MATIDVRLFRWKITFRKYKAVLKAKADWEEWGQGEYPDAIQAAQLDIAAQWLDSVRHPEMATLLRQERDVLVDRVVTPMQIRLRKPKKPKDLPDSAARTPRADLRLAAAI